MKMTKKGAMPKAPPKKPYLASPAHPMNTEQTRGLPRMARGASKKHTLGTILGVYSSEK